jgi:hypothetical protein
MIAQAHIGNHRKQFNELLERSLAKNGISIWRTKQEARYNFYFGN